MNDPNQAERVNIDQDQLDQIRIEFSKRLNEVVEAEGGLVKFAAKADIGLRQLSQLKNPRHRNWPSAQNLIKMALLGDISLNWLLIGVGRFRRVSDIAKQNSIDNPVIKEILEIVLFSPEKEEDILLDDLRQTLKKHGPKRTTDVSVERDVHGRRSGSPGKDKKRFRS